MHRTAREIKKLQNKYFVLFVVSGITKHAYRILFNAYRILFNLRHRVTISSALEQNNICTFIALIRKFVAGFMIRCANSCNIWISSLINSDDFLTRQFYKHFLLLRDR